MAGTADRRERQRIRVALYKGAPVPSEDYDTVRRVLAQIRWSGPLALVFAAVSLLWLCSAVFGHGAFRWTSVLWVLASGVMAWTLLRQRKRILDGVTKMERRRAG